MRGRYKKELAIKKKELHEANELIGDIKHPDFLERVSRRNVLSVDFALLTQKNEDKWHPEHNGPTYTVIIPNNKQK